MAEGGTCGGDKFIIGLLRSLPLTLTLSPQAGRGDDLSTLVPW